MQIRKWLAVAVLLAVPVWVLAQSVVNDRGGYHGAVNGQPAAGVYRTDSTGRVLTMDVDGNAQVVDAARDRDANLSLPDLINNFGATALAIGAADSCVPQDTHDMRLGMLLIKAVVAGTGTVDTTVSVRLAIQIRTHLGGVDDSMSTYPIYAYGRIPMGSGTAAEAAAAVDTMQTGHLYSPLGTPAAATTPSPVNTWSGEQTVIISAMRNAYGNSIDINGNQFYYPNGIAIPLSSLYGRDIYSPSTSIRVRVLTAVKGAATISGPTVFLKVSLVGTPL